MPLASLRQFLVIQYKTDAILGRLCIIAKVFKSSAPERPNLFNEWKKLNCSELISNYTAIQMSICRLGCCVMPAR